MSVSDPSELPRVDREIRHNELLERAGALRARLPENCPDDVAASFLEHLERWEAAPWVSFAELLERDGFTFPRAAPAEDVALNVLVWQIIERLAARRVYLLHTDHLSDRELYAFLLDALHNEATKDLPVCDYGAYYIDVIGSGSDEDIQASLRYYDDEATRQRWRDQFPDDPLPPHQDPPCDRDRFLPRPPRNRRGATPFER